MRVFHINCGTIQPADFPAAACHCLLIEAGGKLALIDTGIGLQDVMSPEERLGKPLIEGAGFLFDEKQTAVRLIESLGYRPGDVRDVVLTHGDPDHSGGLADFPEARVHVSEEELQAIERGGERYRASHFAHRPRWEVSRDSAERWCGLPARRLSLVCGAEASLIPLFGHTLGHCGVAIRGEEKWLLHAGDAYYLRVELTRDDHPVSALAALRAENNEMRIRSLACLRELSQKHSGEVAMLGYHDFSEFPEIPEAVSLPVAT